ncbi:unnamed protein product, partial [marine sediment metagenome]
MKKKILVVFLIGIFMISFASAHWWDPFHWIHDETDMNPEMPEGYINVDMNTIQGKIWSVTKHDGIQEEYFNVSINYTGDSGQNVKVCLIPKELMFANDSIALDMNFTVSNKNEIIEPADIE